jgi:antitoxin PrlF
MSNGEDKATPETDPVLEAYLAFVERDMLAHPERIQAVPADLVARAQDLVGRVEADLDEDLGDDAAID